MKLSILICSLNDRFLNLYRLTEKLTEQIGDRKDQVEVIWLGDIRSMSIGVKREHLKLLAKGKYIAFIDDDDDISDDYVDQMLRAIDKNPDCITFQCEYKNKKTNRRLTVLFGMDYRNLDAKDVSYRMPYHICGIKREIALKIPFTSTNIGEDSTFAFEIFNKCLLKTEVNIPKVLYYYKHDPSISTTSSINRQDLRVPNKVDVVIVSNAKTRELDLMTQKAINSLHGEVVAIVMERHPKIVFGWSETYRQKGNFNYNKCLNEGAKKGHAPIIVFSNNDVIFPDDFIHSVTKLMQGHDVLSFSTQSGILHPTVVSGFCFAMTREAWKKIGGLNEKYNFWCADNVVSEQIKKHGLKELKTMIQVTHLAEQSHKILTKKEAKEFKVDNVKRFNRDYKQNVLNMGK